MPLVLHSYGTIVSSSVLKEPDPISDPLEIGGASSAPAWNAVSSSGPELPEAESRNALRATRRDYRPPGKAQALCRKNMRPSSSQMLAKEIYETISASANSLRCPSLSTESESTFFEPSNDVRAHRGLTDNEKSPATKRARHFCRALVSFDCARFASSAQDDRATSCRSRPCRLRPASTVLSSARACRRPASPW
jgi:hypothetical protein